MQQEELNLNEAISDKLDELSEGQFMQPEITAMQEWVRIENNEGTEIIPAEYFQAENFPTDFSFEYIQGYGARLQAPGCMDCTEWMVFDTPDEAGQQLIEFYGDEFFNL